MNHVKRQHVGLPLLNSGGVNMVSLYVGIDGHKNFSFLCAMTREGEVIEERKVRSEEIEKIVEELTTQQLE